MFQADFIDCGWRRNKAVGMRVTVEYAAEHLDELLDAMDGGGSVEILRPDKPVMRLSGAMLPMAGTRS